MLKSASSRFDRLRGSYFTRFVAGVLAICVVVMGSMVLLLGNIAEGSLTASTSNGVQSVAQEVASKVDSWVQDRERELTQLSNLVQASGANSAQTAIDLIVRATTNDPFDEMELVDANGNTVASTGAAGAISLVGQSWVAGIAESAAPYVGDVTLNAAGNDLQWLFAVPTSTSNLAFYGLLVGSVGLEPWTGPGGGSNQLAGLLSGVTGSGGASTLVRAVDGSGKLLYSTSMGSPATLTSVQMLARGALRTRIATASSSTPSRGSPVRPGSPSAVPTPSPDTRRRPASIGRSWSARTRARPSAGSMPCATRDSSSLGSGWSWPRSSPSGWRSSRCVPSERSPGPPAASPPAISPPG